MYIDVTWGIKLTQATKSSSSSPFAIVFASSTELADTYITLKVSFSLPPKAEDLAVICAFLVLRAETTIWFVPNP